MIDKRENRIHIWRADPPHHLIDPIEQLLITQKKSLLFFRFALKLLNLGSFLNILFGDTNMSVVKT